MSGAKLYEGEDIPCDCEEWLSSPNRIGSWNWCGSKHCVILHGKRSYEPDPKPTPKKKPKKR